MTRLTCKQALKARYSVLGKHPGGASEYAPSLSFEEARRFYYSLLNRGYIVEAKVVGAFRSIGDENLA